MDTMQFRRQEAAAFIFEKLKQDPYPIPEGDLRQFVADAADQEDRYMAESGFFSEETGDDDVIYDEEDAFHYILGGLLQMPRYKTWKESMVEDLVDDYLEYNYDFMVEAGLVEE